MTAARLLLEAEEELLAAATFYARIERAEIRLRTVGRFPYRVYYRARRDEILVVALGHRHRRPGYWRSRVVT
jgi:ParE toxin of type II toxin-antitoxin system, parDE